MAETGRLAVTQSGKVTVVTFQDASILDMLSVQQIGQELKAVIGAAPSPQVVLDLSRVVALSSAALGILISGRKHVSQVGGKVAICGVRQELRKILNLTGLDRLFECHETVEAAVHAVGG